MAVQTRLYPTGLLANHPPLRTLQEVHSSLRNEWLARQSSSPFTGAKPAYERMARASSLIDRRRPVRLGDES